MQAGRVDELMEKAKEELSDRLPVGATATSHTLLALAAELVRDCPPHLGSEIALTGSASRGVADDYSDIELALWIETIPPPAERIAWLRSLGIQNIAIEDDMLADGSTWTDFYFHGVPIEVGWQSIERAEAQLAAILRGDVIDRDHLSLAWIVQHAVPLRSKGRLASWQNELRTYPAGLVPRLMADAIAPWNPFWFPHDHHVLAARGDIVWLTHHLVTDVESIMRLLFALNRQWEPEVKWLTWQVAALNLKPENLSARIDSVFTASEPMTQIAAVLRLIEDTLALVPELTGGMAIREAIRDSQSRK